MNSAVIVAAGKGTRMGKASDKLFLEADGRPIIAHTWKCLDQSPNVDEIIVVIRPEREAAFRQTARLIGAKKPFQLTRGGARRQDSVLRGLEATNESACLVAVHDGARPCVSGRILADCFAKAGRWGAAIAAAKVANTLKEADDKQRILQNVDRARLWAAQTPQVFRREILMRALRCALETGAQITDEAAACELIRQPVILVENHDPNPKVTTQTDLPFVEWLLSRKSQE